jgi:hypothetical protein
MTSWRHKQATKPLEVSEHDGNTLLWSIEKTKAQMGLKCRDTVERLIKAGELQAISIRHRKMVIAQSVRDLIARQGTQMDLEAQKRLKTMRAQSAQKRLETIKAKKAQEAQESLEDLIEYPQLRLIGRWPWLREATFT